MSIKMTFDEIKINREKFLDEYDLKDAFEKNHINWDELLKIGEDYETKRNSEYFSIIQEYLSQISQFNNVHSYRYRIKTTDSLLAKIIRKNKIVTVDDYYTKISDLLGIRILYIFKDDYLSIHQQIMEKYGSRLAESVHLKLRDGDEESTYKQMLDEYDIKVEKNKVYRSIHYTIYAKTNIAQTPKLEIQTRTIFEEGWSEINHKLVYKKSSDNQSHIERASGILSELIGSCDAIGSLMKYIYEENQSMESYTPSECVGDNTPVTNAELSKEQKVGIAIAKFLLK